MIARKKNIHTPKNPAAKLFLTLLTAILIILNLSIARLSAQDADSVKGPVEYVYDSGKAIQLKVYLFRNAEKKAEKNQPAIVIFHGGGWHAGDPSWCFGLAKKYARMGMVAVAAQYRLSDNKGITPKQAMEDAASVIVWLKKSADKLGIDLHRIVACGWSAGAHLAAGTAVFCSNSPDKKISSMPAALILVSPALSITNDTWFAKLMGKVPDLTKYSPAENIAGKMPPTIIAVGRDDTVTPVEQSRLFQANMQKHDNMCRLMIFNNVGHMFTPSTQSDKGMPNPDKKIRARAWHAIDQFLRELKFLD